MADPQQQQRARRGCLFYGCIVGVVLMLMLLVGVLFGIHQVQKMLSQFTDSKPMALPTVNLSPAQINELHQRVNTFSNAVVSGKPNGPLTLNSDEINALLQDAPGNKGLNGKAYVLLQDDKVKAQISLPMGETGFRFLRNRYLNGDATLNVSLRNGVLGVYLDQVNVKGKPLPQVYMQNIRHVNWAEDANTNRASSSALNKLQGIEVKEGKLILTPVEGPEKKE